MSCPLFVDSKRCTCLAVAGPMIPSVHEREQFCRSADYKACPTLLARVSKGAPISEEEYYDLWLAPRVHHVLEDPSRL